MTASLDLAIQRVRALYDAEQDNVASLLLELVVPSTPVGLSEAQKLEVERRQRDFASGRTAPVADHEVGLLWARCGI
jgi:hypothetical protein